MTGPAASGVGPKLASREGLDSSCASRLADLTVPSPEIVARILDDGLPDRVVLLDLAVDPPAGWAEQWGRAGP